MDAFVTRKRQRSNDAPDKPDVARNPSISPPPKRNGPKLRGEAHAVTTDLTESDVEAESPNEKTPRSQEASGKVFPSPIQLNHIQTLPSLNNVDTLKLNDMLGDPMIKECWLFNYLFDIDFIM